jgi:hypothetical protein
MLGAMMSIDGDLVCSFQVLKPAEKPTMPFEAVRPKTPPKKKN